MKKAWVENDTIRELSVDPFMQFHPDIARLFTVDVTDDTSVGAIWDGLTWVNPPVVVQPPEPEAVVQPIEVSPIEFKLLFTSSERIAIKASVDPIVMDFFSIIEDPRLTKVVLTLQSTQNALAYLEAIGLLAPGRKEAISTGVIT